MRKNRISGHSVLLLFSSQRDILLTAPYFLHGYFASTLFIFLLGRILIVYHKQAIVKICMGPSPTLAQPEKWSPSFSDFLTKCLEKHVPARSTAAEIEKV